MISATDMRGLSELNGSWKTICIWRRSGRISAELQACDVVAVEADAALRGDHPQQGKAKRRLAGPDSPTSPSVWPARTATIDAVDGFDMVDGAAQASRA